MNDARPKLLSVEAWIQATYGAGAPSVRTVRRWISGGYIIPTPEKQGRGYYVRSDARYVDPANPPADLKPSGRAYPLLEKAGFIPTASSLDQQRRGARPKRMD